MRFRNSETDNYDFTFKNAHASDKPDMEYFYKIKVMTVPQYNFHIGYFFNNKRNFGIELSWDHLKYVVNDYQSMFVSGNVRGHAINKDTVVTPDFVHLQHTNGNNYLMINMLKRTDFVKKKNIKISAIGKVGAGPLVSYTISSVLGNYDKGAFYYHGMVYGLSTTLRLELLKYFFIETSLQGAFANYTNTRLGADHKGLATHRFFSLQYMYGAGLTLPLSVF
ncbi:MAG: hypothetical protein H7329_18650 [Opitutaceae bacterium]|nr:hypothetical protein [Cytophagales bacterium]